uniref:alpha/beta fold hydrolase n=1 Tax=unclassified Rhodococcus (in: high G+C Gram-positive bacteria) TaxID=192944 RepID=UPI0020CD542B|nr:MULTISPECIES: alpha/beta fold hydrolase [unclassified Rhodococcus (in: high G+C Gram-positive bacteria)]
MELQLTGSGPALLLLAGQANNHHWWDRVRDDYARAFTVVTFDYRGTGRSTLGSESLSTRSLAQDAIRCLDTLGITRAHVFGTSMGGRVAQWIAIDAGSRLDRLVLGCTTPGGAYAEERSEEVRRSLVADSSDTRDVLASLMYTDRFRAAARPPYNTLGDAAMTPSARTAHLRASATHDAWDRLAHIESPTLVLHGTDDRLMPVANGRLLASRIPNAVIRTFDGTRHAFFEERAVETFDAIARFTGVDTDSLACR